ncbi:MAG: STING domain-containing protein [Kovacikia sp.]
METATAFATTYYYGFVLLVCEAINSGRAIEVGQDTWRDSASRQARLVIVLPEALERTVKEQTSELVQQRDLQEVYIDCPDRTRVALALSNKLVLVDVPTVLDSIPYTLPTSISEAERSTAEAVALRQFREELSRLIAGNEVCRLYATVQGWDWWQAIPVSP